MSSNKLIKLTLKTFFKSQNTKQKLIQRKISSILSGYGNRFYSSQPAAAPHIEGEEKKYSEKISKIVDDIGKLTLLEVSDLNELLKKTLKISDAAFMPMGVAAAPAPQKEEEEVAEVKQAKTSFTVRILKFEESKKVALIKEVKNQVSGLNLVQAKKFVESVPSIVKTDASKEEAESLKTSLSAAGATVEIQ